MTLDLRSILLKHRACPHWAAKLCRIEARDGCACREACEAIRRALDRERQRELFPPSPARGG